MTKLNRSHGIEVGSKVKVLTSEGCKAYDDLVGTIQIVTGVHTDSNPYFDIIEVAGRWSGEGQWPSRYELVKDFNGVDGSGNPHNFTKADLKPFQRVKMGDGRFVMVTLNSKGETGFTYEHASWMPAVIDHDGGNEDYDVQAVYAPPCFHGDALTMKVTGDLIWQRTDAAKLQAIKDADAAITKAREELAKAEAARAVL